MIDLTKITSFEANKIECALVTLEDCIKEKIETYKRLSQRTDLPESFIKTSKSNLKWWKEVYELIYKN